MAARACGEVHIFFIRDGLKPGAPLVDPGGRVVGGHGQ
jgi:hypothetical protein